MMKHWIALALAATTLPALAESHGPDLTMTSCADFAAMDKDGMMAVTEAVDSMKMMEGMSDDEVMKAKEDMMEMSDDEMAEHMKMAEESMMMLAEHCADMGDMTVMDAAKSDG